jgi:hypothetical protein
VSKSSAEPKEVLMRRFITLPAIVALTLAAAALPAAAAEITRTLRVEIPGAEGFAIENLAGTMRVTRGGGAAVTAVATLHAENEELAGLVRFERVRESSSRAVYRVIYPTDRHRTFRYPHGHDSGSTGTLLKVFGLGSSSSAEYGGERVKVSASEGVLLYADVEVQVPARAIDGVFKNLVGALEAQNVEGKLLFDSGSGDITLDKVRGTVRADTGSGDVRASDIEGSFDCDTGSGDCRLAGFRGETITCDVGSGDVHVRGANARSIDADTGSGDVRAVDVDVVDFSADTGSGDVVLEVSGQRLARVNVDTGSGDVTLRLGPDASFEALADQGSGDIENHFADAQPIFEHKELLGYRRGDARTKIKVDTGSGDLVLDPGRPSARNAE